MAIMEFGVDGPVSPSGSMGIVMPETAKCDAATASFMGVLLVSMTRIKAVTHCDNQPRRASLQRRAAVRCRLLDVTAIESFATILDAFSEQLSGLFGRGAMNDFPGRLCLAAKGAGGASTRRVLGS
jgi:hypothetical protein